MNWKEFLKLTKWRIIIVAILIPLTYLISWIVYKTFETSSNLLNIINIIFFPQGLYLFFEYNLKIARENVMSCIIPGCESISLIFSLIISIFIYYFLSCLIIFIYQKLRGENETKTIKNLEE